MSHRLHSENTKQRLFISMLIIILSILFISVPVTLKSYRSYQQSDVVLTEISVLRHVADLANEISRERGPANKVMSSTPDELSANLKELTLFRERVDLQIEHTMQLLNSAGFAAQANALTTDLKPALAKDVLRWMPMQHNPMPSAVQHSWIRPFRPCFVPGMKSMRC